MPQQCIVAPACGHFGVGPITPPALGDDAPLHLSNARGKIVDLHHHGRKRLAVNLWDVGLLVFQQCDELGCLVNSAA
jgi:hypothetical protein